MCSSLYLVLCYPVLSLPFRRVLLAMYPQFAGPDLLSDVVLKWYHVTVFAYARTTAITTFASFLPHRAPTRLMPSDINTTKALPTKHHFTALQLQHGHLARIATSGISFSLQVGCTRFGRPPGIHSRSRYGGRHILSYDR